MSYGVEIGSIDNPQRLFSQLCHKVNLSAEYFTLLDRSDICWAWEVNPEYHKEYLAKRSAVKDILTDWIAHGKVKYASW